MDTGDELAQYRALEAEVNDALAGVSSAHQRLGAMEQAGPGGHSAHGIEAAAGGPVEAGALHEEASGQAAGNNGSLGVGRQVSQVHIRISLKWQKFHFSTVVA